MELTPREKAAVVGALRLLGHMWMEGRYVPPEIGSVLTGYGKVKELTVDELYLLAERMK
jgi:hypothetical protein